MGRVDVLGRLFAEQWAAYVKRCHSQGKDPNMYARHAAPPKERIPPVIFGHASVYVIKVGEGLYKVGQSWNVQQRVKELSASHPYSLEIIHTIKAKHPRTAEAALHHQLAYCWVRGEIFRIDDETLSKIKRIKEIRRDVNLS
jgi:hypothetical protein